MYRWLLWFVVAPVGSDVDRGVFWKVLAPVPVAGW
jgi:hypothetical protein